VSDRPQQDMTSDEWIMKWATGHFLGIFTAQGFEPAAWPIASSPTPTIKV
jgi:hypothetical protein